MKSRNILLFIIVFLASISISSAADIAGFVYSVKYDGVYSDIDPVSGAVVVAYNDTWSKSTYSLSTGAFSFTGVKTGETYYITVTKSGYSSTTVTGLVGGGFVDIYLNPDASPNYRVPHYTKFTLQNIWGTTKYENVNVIVYENASIKTTGKTGSDGVFGALLSENTYYRITFKNATQNIDREWKGYPIDDEYNIIVFNAGFREEKRPVDDILFGITSTSINTTKGYINVTYNDTSTTTLRAKLFINDTNANPLYYQSSTNYAGNFSQMVDAVNNTYVVTFWIDNTQIDEPLKVTRIITLYNQPKVDVGWDENWHYIATSVLIVIGIVALFTTRNAEIGAIVGVMAGWFFLWLGWSVMGMSVMQTTTVGLMLLLGTVIAYGAYIRGEY